MQTKSNGRLDQHLRLYRKARQLLCDDVSEYTLTYLFMLHLVAGISQSQDSDLRCKDYAKVDFLPYAEEISKCKSVLNDFFINENASVLGKIRIRAFCHAMQNKRYMLAGRIMGLK